MKKEQLIRNRKVLEAAGLTNKKKLVTELQIKKKECERLKSDKDKAREELKKKDGELLEKDK